MTAKQANTAVIRGIAAVGASFSVTTVPLADGGEGSLEALTRDTADTHAVTVEGPLRGTHDTHWSYDRASRTAVIEGAAVAGHGAMGGAAYDPDRASSFGIGQVISQAVSEGAQTVIVGLGGSVSVDAGAGALEALGARYLDSVGNVLERPAGRGLTAVSAIDLRELDARLADVTIVLAADVDNPLAGERGAAAVFGPQKGVPINEVDAFDRALSHFDALLAATRGREPFTGTPFAGAAGGMMVGLAGAARLMARDGFSLVSEERGLPEAVAAADWVVTGEGSLDQQSLGGKGPVALARMARDAGRPAIAFAGRVAAPFAALRQEGLVSVYSVSAGPQSLEDALANGPSALEDAAAHVFSTIATALRL